MTQIGNGAKKSPWYLSKIYSLSDIEPLTNMDKPFLIQTKTDYKRIFIDENGYERVFGWRGEESIWEYLFNYINYKKQEINFPWVLSQFSLLCGCIPIIRNVNPSSIQDIVRQYILILNGDYRGEIWRIDETTMQPMYNTEMHINILTIMEAIAYGGL